VPIGICGLALILAQGAGDPSLRRVDPVVVVLSDTGTTREGLPLVVSHPDPRAYAAVLDRGYARRVVRLYAMAQRFVRPGVPPQPAYLLLTDNQGGFPRHGFFLDTRRPDVAYVDLHRRSTPSGRPGALDQIYPHELLHLIVEDLAGPPPEGHATQVHAVGVRTDRVTAFNEGFAEHGQVMAIDDPDASPDTHAIATNTGLRTLAFGQFDVYRATLGARIRIAPKAVMTFPLWFSSAEQVLRYHAVRENLFARQPDVPRRMYTAGRAHDAYLLDNTLPGRPGATRRPLGRLLSTEGVISALFHELVTDAAIQQVYRDGSFYGPFGASRAAIDPLDNAYLKIFAAIRAGGHDASAVIDAYARLFPDERPALDMVVRRVFAGQDGAAPPEVWLLNDAFLTGTSLFDQFRGLPRVSAFDLNASSLADLVAVPGVDVSLAESIAREGPFKSIDDVAAVTGMTPAVLERFRDMRRAMLQPPSPGTAAEGGLTFKRILMPYLWRALGVWIACAALGAAFYRAVRRLAWWRVPINGLAAAFMVLLVAWTVEPETRLFALVVPVVLCGLPGAVIRAVRSRRPREAGMVIVAWALAGLPAAIAVTPLG
jgi:hypothetical protein